MQKKTNCEATRILGNIYKQQILLQFVSMLYVRNKISCIKVELVIRRIKQIFEEGFAVETVCRYKVM